MNDYRKETNSVEESKGKRELFQIVGQDCTSDFDDCKLVCSRKDSQITFDFLL